MSDFQDIWDAQERLQIKTFGVAPVDMPPREAVEYIKQMVLECTDELHEILGELVGWKGHDDRSPVVNAKQIAGEARDAFQYIVNIMLAVGLTPDQLQAIYWEKMAVNLRRLEAGYASAEKCGVCKRSLDDPGSTLACSETACPSRKEIQE